MKQTNEREQAERRKLNKSISKKGRAVITALLCVAFVVILFVVVTNLFFRVQKITVTGVFAHTENEVVEASGIETGSLMYPMDKPAIKSRIKAACPYVDTIYIDRILPATVEIRVTESKPAYCLYLFGENVVLSSSLQVINCSVTPERASALGAKKAYLPDVLSAVEGEKITFRGDSDTSYIADATAAILACDLYSRVTELDFRDKFDLSMTVDGKFRIELGNTSELQVKLVVAAKVLEDSVFEGAVGGKINVENPKEAITVIN